MSELNLGDIPDLSGFAENDGPSPFEDGWYQGTIQEQRTFVDRNGNDQVFVSADAPSANGDSRNIRLQVEIKRATDGRTLNTNTLVNYRPEDLTQETVQAVTKRRAESGDAMGDLFRPFITLTRLAKLGKIAGGRQLQRNGNGGLDITPLYGKTAYFRLKEDSRNPQYKEVADFRHDAPKRARVL